MKDYRIIKHSWRKSSTGEIGHTFYVEELVTEYCGIIKKRKVNVWRRCSYVTHDFGHPFRIAYEFETEEEARKFAERIMVKVPPDEIIQLSPKK